MHLGGERIDNRQAADDALLVGVTAAAEAAAHTGGRVGGDVGAAFARPDIEELGLVGVGRRPKICTAVDVGARIPDGVGDGFPIVIIGLHVLAGIVVERLAGLRINPFGPVQLRDILHSHEELAVETVEGVVETVTVRVNHQLAVVAIDLAVDDDLRA